MMRFLFCVVLATTACKKDSKTEGGGGTGTASGSAVVAADAAEVAIDAPAPAGSGSAPGAGTAAAVTLPKEVAELGATLEALVKEPEGDARSKKTCGMEMELKKQARAVAMNKPASVDQAAWDEANQQISSALEGLGPSCTDDPPDDSIELPNLYKGYQAVVALLK